MKTLSLYILGYSLSLLFTFGSFCLVAWHLLSGHEFPPHELAVPVLIVFALLQLAVQLVFFLHVGKHEPNRDWNLTALGFTFVIVIILVGGTLWIMSNLAHMQKPAEPNVFEEENIFPDHAHT